MTLNYKKSGQGQPLIILHGLFGMLDNWQSISRELASDFEVWLIDQRNHGRSPHAETHSYDDLADDLRQFIVDHEIVDPLLVGHSMGGKTVMRFAQKYPELTSGIVVVDMGVKLYPIHHDHIIEALNAVPLHQVSSRSEAEEFLMQHIDVFGIRQFLLKNLHRKADGGYEWRFNLPVLEQSMPDIVAALPQGSSQVKTLFLYGTQSDYVLPADIEQLRNYFPNSEFQEVRAGHWVHAEQPDTVIAAIRSFAQVVKS
jgi:pimeloyl-ACP methyl ester carboxylesterase